MRCVTLVALLFLLAALWLSGPVRAGELRVPTDFRTVQAALDAAQPGDTVLVSAGRYRERVRLRPGVILRSAGDDAAGQAGLRRAEATILDGGGAGGDQPGVTMAEGAVLDGLTITGVGLFDEAVWKRHYESQGEELADDEGSVQAEGTVPAVSIRGVECTVSRCLVHHNGDVGIAVVGVKDRALSAIVRENVVSRNLGGGIGAADYAAAIIRGNRCSENLRAGVGCRNARPLIEGNVCYGNIRAGIGCREGAEPIIRGNRCYQNRRAGIGIRMPGTAPVVEDNECDENQMAGIGCRDGAEPIIRQNHCRKNVLAGIGCDGAKPLLIANECRENALAGIGLRGGADALIRANRCLDNKLVAIGVTEGSRATIIGNQLARTGGAPPLIAVKESAALIAENQFTGGGVAAVLVQGQVQIRGNRFQGQGPNQGAAVWVWEGGETTVDANQFDGYRHAVNASKARVTATGNQVRGFRGAAFLIQDSSQPAHLVGNKAYSTDPQAQVVKLTGPAGAVADNVLEREPEKAAP